MVKSKWYQHLVSESDMLKTWILLWGERMKISCVGHLWLNNPMSRWHPHPGPHMSLNYITHRMLTWFSRQSSRLKSIIIFKEGRRGRQRGILERDRRFQIIDKPESEVPRLNEVQLTTKVSISNGKGTIPTKAVIQIDEEFQIPK